MAPHLAELGATRPDELSSRVLDQLAVNLAAGGRSPATVATDQRTKDLTSRMAGG